MNCFVILFQDILDDFDANDTISTSNIHTFCYSGCGQYIKTLYGKITKDCPGSTDGNVSSILAYAIVCII